MGKFDLSDISGQIGGAHLKIGGQTGPGDWAMGRKIVSYDKILPNELNKEFDQEAVEEIMLSIQENGLFHELAVTYDSTEDVYRLISGEQRYRAIGMMSDNVRNSIFPQGIPVNVLSFNGEIDETIAIYEANLIQRKYTPEMKHKLVMELLELYEQKEKAGEISNARKELAKKLDIKTRQMARYAAANKIIPELKKALEEGQINLREAEKFAALNEVTQKQIAEMLQRSGKVSEEEVAALKKYEEANKALEKQIAQVKKGMDERDQKIAVLTEELEKAKNDGATEKDQTETDKEVIQSLTEKLVAAEKEKKKAQTTLDNLRIEMQERQGRGITATKEELKKAADIAKCENLFETFFVMAKEIEKIKDVIKGDETLYARYDNAVKSIVKALEK